MQDAILVECVNKWVNEVMKFALPSVFSRIWKMSPSTWLSEPESWKSSLFACFPFLTILQVLWFYIFNGFSVSPFLFSSTYKTPTSVWSFYLSLETLKWFLVSIFIPLRYFCPRHFIHNSRQVYHSPLWKIIPSISLSRDSLRQSYSVPHDIIFPIPRHCWLDHEGTPD